MTSIEKYDSDIDWVYDSVSSEEDESLASLKVMLQLSEDLSSMCKEGATNNEEDRETGLFHPPLYKQRYYAVAEVINKVKARSVLDMGCSEGQFLEKIKDLCPTVTEITGVDINIDVLERNMFRLKPLTFEYVERRPLPLKMSMYCGSIGSPDVHFKDVDVIACIEVIEHLYDEVLHRVPGSLFGCLQPKVVVLTTPNSEYNVVFNNFSGMRHWDHKFEWTQKEFHKWCENIVKVYGYNVEYSGVGDPPVGTNIGFCSQMAVFTRKDCHLCSSKVTKPIDKMTAESMPMNTTESQVLQTAESKYKLVKEVTYPYNDLNENRTEKLLHEMTYVINQYYSDIPDNVEDCFMKAILITDFMKYPSLMKYNASGQDIVHLMETYPTKYSLSEDEKYLQVTFDIYDDDERLSASPDVCEEEFLDNKDGHALEENWD